MPGSSTRPSGTDPASGPQSGNRPLRSPPTMGWERGQRRLDAVPVVDASLGRRKRRARFPSVPPGTRPSAPTLDAVVGGCQRHLAQVVVASGKGSVHSPPTTCGVTATACWLLDDRADLHPVDPHFSGRRATLRKRLSPKGKLRAEPRDTAPRRRSEPVTRLRFPDLIRHVRREMEEKNHPLFMDPETTG